MNFPRGFIESLRGTEGFDEESFKAVHESGEQVTSVRFNPNKNYQPQTTNFKPVPWCSHAYYLPERPFFTFDPVFHGGAYYVQEAGSMFLRHALSQVVPDLNASLKIIDVCAAPGGKSTLLASLFPNALLIANEVIKSRASILAENLVKWGTENVIVTNSDPGAFSKISGYADVIVIDAPCSGSGLFRKDPEAINEWSEESVTLCSKRQHRILEDMMPCLKKNGILVYSTCSYSEEEDEDVMEWLVKEKGLKNIRLSVPAEWNIVESERDNNFGYRFYPDKTKSEGFFISIFVNENETEESYAFGSLAKIMAKESAVVEEWISNIGEHMIFKQGDHFNAIAKRFEADVKFLQNHLYIRKAGVILGELKGRDFIPAHDLAVSTIPLASNIPVASLTKDAALQFLRKQNIDHEFAVKGWNLVQHENINLGWVKVLPNRVNNYYPVEWRILKD